MIINAGGAVTFGKYVCPAQQMILNSAPIVMEKPLNVFSRLLLWPREDLPRRAQPVAAARKDAKHRPVLPATPAARNNCAFLSPPGGGVRHFPGESCRDKYFLANVRNFYLTKVHFVIDIFS